MKSPDLLNPKSFKQKNGEMRYLPTILGAGLLLSVD